MRLTTMIAAAVLFAVTGYSAQAQDADAGKKVFNKCKACHSAEDTKNKVGPHLNGVVGRDVGAVEDYKYSDAMTGWGEGKTWDAETLDAFLTDPKGTVDGTKMTYAGLKKEEDRANVIAYLESVEAK